MIRQLFKLCLLATVATIAAVSCSCGSSDSQTTLCQPGENIFCRCKGGAPGTKTCKKSGNSFDSCVNERGDSCAEIVDDTGSTYDPSSSSGYGGSYGGYAGSATHGGGGEPVGTGGFGTGGATGAKQLYDTCTADDECESGACPMGYCTQICTDYMECFINQAGDCIQFAAVALCAPYCNTKDDCLNAYGAPSTCGYSTTIDMYNYNTCADWNGDLQVEPVGTSCSSNTDCNLGNEGTAVVCASNSCATGCFDSTDCPGAETCNGSTSTVPGDCL